MFYCLTHPPAEFYDAFPETTPSLSRSVVCWQLGPAGVFVWARGAVPSWDGTSNPLYHQDLTRSLWLKPLSVQTVW